MTGSRAADVLVADIGLHKQWIARMHGAHEPTWRCGSAADFGRRLRGALALDVPSMIVLPIDATIDVAISDEPPEEKVMRR